MIQYLNKLFKPFAGMQLLKQILLVPVINAHILRNIVADKSRIPADNEVEQHFGSHVARKLDIFVKEIYGSAHQRLALIGIDVLCLVRYPLYHSHKIWLLGDKLRYRAPVEPLSHYLAQLAAGLTNHLADAADHAVLIQIVGLRQIGRYVLLRYEEYLLIGSCRAI